MSSTPFPECLSGAEKNEGWYAQMESSSSSQTSNKCKQEVFLL